MSNIESQILKIEDSHGFHYEVEVTHSPSFGFSTAYYKGYIIADCAAYRITKPRSDDDLEWEKYFERFAEWRDEILSTIKPKCKQYFDRK